MGRPSVLVRNVQSLGLVQGKVSERTGIDGKSYAIGFELRLPVGAARNGRFLHQTNGGTDGMDPANASAAFAQGVMFGLDPRARRDYGYAANGTMAPIAKGMLQACDDLDGIADGLVNDIEACQAKVPRERGRRERRQPRL